jgi:hypothetical protein
MLQVRLGLLDHFRNSFHALAQIRNALFGRAEIAPTTDKDRWPDSDCKRAGSNRFLSALQVENLVLDVFL